MLEFMITPSIVLKKAVATISLMATEALICYSPNGLYIEAVATGEYKGRIVAILRINVATADCFRCNVVGEAKFYPSELYRALDTVNTEEWSVKVSSANEDDMVSFVFANPRIGGFKVDEMRMFPSNPEEINGPTAVHDVEYRSVVGIPSLEFIRILTHFFFHGERVQMVVTEKRVTFSSIDGNEKIVLKKKNQDCIIGGVDYEFTISIVLGFLPLFLNAAAQTPTVWLLKAEEINEPFMLNFPVGSFLGNLMLYFL